MISKSLRTIKIKAMSDIFENIELSDTFNQDQLINELFKRSLGQEAEIIALRTIICALLQTSNGLTEDQASRIIVKAVDDKTGDVFVNNIFLAEAWKKKNNKDLGLE